MNQSLIPVREAAAKSKPPVRKNELIAAMLLRAEQKHVELDKSIKEKRRAEEKAIAALLLRELKKLKLNESHVQGFDAYGGDTITIKLATIPNEIKERIRVFRNMPFRAPDFKKERVREQIRESLTGDHKPKALELLSNPEMVRAIDAALVEVGTVGATIEA